MTTPSTTMTAQAQAAYEAKLSADATAAEDVRKALRIAATAALRDVLVKPDGTRMTLGELNLTVKDSNVDAGRVVWTDGTNHLSAIFREEQWRVFVVAQVDGRWTRINDHPPVKSLADIGAVLAKAAV